MDLAAATACIRATRKSLLWAGWSSWRKWAGATPRQAPNDYATFLLRLLFYSSLTSGSDMCATEATR